MGMLIVAVISWIVILIIQIIVIKAQDNRRYNRAVVQTVVPTVVPVKNQGKYQQPQRRTDDVILPTSEVVEEPYPFSDKDKAKLLAGLPSDDDDIVHLSDDDYAYMLYMEEQYEIQQMNTELSQTQF